MQVRTGVLDCPPDEPLPAPGGQAAVRPHRQQRARHPRQAAGAGPQAGATQQNMQVVVTILFFQINPYVNGALYSLLGNKDINTVAQDMGIENKIIEKCQVRDTDTLGKWSFILLPTAGLRGGDQEAAGVHPGPAAGPGHQRGEQRHQRRRERGRRGRGHRARGGDRRGGPRGGAARRGGGARAAAVPILVQTRARAAAGKQSLQQARLCPPRRQAYPTKNWVSRPKYSLINKIGKSFLCIFTFLYCFPDDTK